MTLSRIRLTTADGRKYEGDIDRFGRHSEGRHSSPAVFLHRENYFDPILGFWKSANRVVVPFSVVAKVERLAEEKELKEETV